MVILPVPEAVRAAVLVCGKAVVQAAEDLVVDLVVVETVADPVAVAQAGNKV